MFYTLGRQLSYSGEQNKMPSLIGADPLVTTGSHMPCHATLVLKSQAVLSEKPLLYHVSPM